MPYGGTEGGEGRRRLEDKTESHTGTIYKLVPGDYPPESNPNDEKPRSRVVQKPTKLARNVFFRSLETRPDKGTERLSEAHAAF
eukprot:3941776-Rhodomonas_salina.3